MGCCCIVVEIQSLFWLCINYSSTWLPLAFLFLDFIERIYLENALWSKYASQYWLLFMFCLLQIWDFVLFYQPDLGQPDTEEVRLHNMVNHSLNLNREKCSHFMSDSVWIWLDEPIKKRRGIVVSVKILLPFFIVY